MAMYLYLKAIHIIFVITWFAGLFYMGRLLIYNREAFDKSDQEKEILIPQYNLMISRLWYIITWPSAIITLIVGVGLWHTLAITPNWLILKLIFVIVLYLYHFSIHKLVNQQKAMIFKYDSMKLRFWNEVPTILLFAIVMLAVVKQNIALAWGALFLFVLIVVLIMGIRVYRRLRNY